MLLRHEAPACIESLIGYKFDPATLFRWANSGKNGVRLPSAMVGNRKFTSDLCIEWFLLAIGAVKESS